MSSGSPLVFTDLTESLSQPGRLFPLVQSLSERLAKTGVSAIHYQPYFQSTHLPERSWLRLQHVIALRKQKPQIHLCPPDLSVGAEEGRDIYYWNSIGPLDIEKYHKRFPQALRIVVRHEEQRRQIAERCGAATEAKTLVIPPHITDDLEIAARSPLFTVDEADAPAEWLATGMHVPLADWISLLKGFSQFKKRQRSSMRLRLEISETQIRESLQQELRSYLYRAEVLVCVPDDPCRRPYAALVMGHHPSGLQRLFSLMREGVALILPDDPSARAFGGTDVEYGGPQDVGVGQAMMLLYKDESLRNQLSERIHARAAAQTLSRERDTWVNLLTEILP